MEEQELLRSNVLKGEYQKNLDELEKTKSYKKENSRLLYFLERGINLHLQGKYEQSIIAFEKAKEIHNSLYTESITKKMETFVINDSSDNYYGETYERSLIHYYLSLNHLLLYQDNLENPNDRNDLNQKIYSSRAEILLWDSYLKEQVEEKRGEAFFKNDLMAKVYGALVHEIISTKEDKQIALQLYKDAKVLVFRNYNSYPSFNKKYAEFNKNFSKFPEMSEDKIREKFVDETIFQTDLMDFLDYKIVSLTKEIRPLDLPNVQKLFKIKKKMTEKRSPNVSILLERGIIPKKQAKIVYFPLGSYIYANPNDSISTQVKNYGAEDVFYYARNNLGFKRIPSDFFYESEVGNYTPNQYAGDLGISFEVPIFKNSSHQEEKIKLVIFDHNGNEIKKDKFLLISPIGDIAENALKEKESGRNLRMGFRLASKYLAVIISSYATYNGLKKNMSPGLATFLAITEYYLATKAIEELEKADLRYWSTLPQNIFLANTYLLPGEYRINAQIEDIITGETTSQFLGKFKINSSENKKLLKFRISN